MIDPFASLLVRLALGGLMVAAGVHKLRDMPRFADAVAAYRLVPDALARPAAGGIALAEVALAALVLLPVAGLARAGLAGIAALLLLYGAAMGINLARGRRHIDCGCLGFGAHGQRISWALVLRNLALAALAIGAVAFPPAARLLLWIDWIGILCATAAAALLYAMIETMLISARWEKNR